MPSPCSACQRSLKCKSLDRYNSSGTCDRELSCQRQGHNLPCIVCLDCFEQQATARYEVEATLADVKQCFAEKDEEIMSLREQVEEMQLQLQFLRTWDNPFKDPHAEIVFYSAEGEMLHAHRVILVSAFPVSPICRSLTRLTGLESWPLVDRNHLTPFQCNKTVNRWTTGDHGEGSDLLSVDQGRSGNLAENPLAFGYLSAGVGAS
jgi:hypothetical protein